MLPDFLLPAIASIELLGIEMQEERLCLQVKTNSASSLCPTCQQASHRVHSTYTRILSDLPWAGIQARIYLKVRRLFCEEPSCPRKFFTERLEGLQPHSRRTNRMNTQLFAIGIKAGANPGATLARTLGMPTSASTLLRLVHATGDAEFETPRVLGVDDWAIRKGQTYGTILVDLERRKPIDLLPNRESETLASWLKQHPGVEVVSRDRAPAYAEGVAKGAPDAEPVADRWHLLKNLTDALKVLMDRQNQANRQAAVEMAEKKRVEETAPLSQPADLSAIGPGSDKPTVVEKLLSKYEMMFEEVKKLYKEGLSIREIHRRTGVNRKTIARYQQYDHYPQRAFSKGQLPQAAAFEDYLRKRWQEGIGNYRQLWKEIKEQGYEGSYVSLFKYMVKYYQNNEQADDKVTPLQLKLYSARRLSYLLGKQTEELEEKDAHYLEHLFRHCPEAELANRLALQFKKIIRERKVEQLDKWMEDAIESGAGVLKNFAQGLVEDYDAVKNACSLEWSNGQVEGQVNRLKNIKRQMYGRASFKLLKKKVLADTG